MNDAMQNYNYHMDDRVISASIRRGKVSKDRLGKPLLVWAYEDPETDEETVYTLPMSLEVCGMCEGSGSVTNPSIDAGGLTQEDFADDEDFASDYFSGAYDMTCPECGGLRVVPEVQREDLSPEQARVLALYDEWQADEYAFARECAFERAMGC